MLSWSVAPSVCVLSALAACSSASTSQYMFGSDSGADITSSGGPPGDATISLMSAPTYSGPTSCAQAAMQRSYIGCDYWPTVTTNPVWSIFDFTAVVANAQVVPAMITVTGPNSFSTTVTVAPGTLEQIYLPWVPALKGPDCDQCGNVPLFAQSVSAPGSAYHLVSSVPVTVYQFNALEYKGQGGPAGKDWSACPGSSQLCAPPDAGVSFYAGCFSYTNDASLLIPSTAMTGNYRVAGEHAAIGFEGSYFAVTATTDSTTVTVTLASTGSVVASAPDAGVNIVGSDAGGTITLMMNAGDVVELMSDMNADTSDLSGSLVHADQPIQVIAGTQCTLQPEDYTACDHLESSMLPAETLGTDYVVTVPTSPGATAVGHVVRFYGNHDDTTLTYSPMQPVGCPTTLVAGEVVQCAGVVSDSFEVTGTHEFAVSSFQVGGSLIAEHTGLQSGDGDPSMSPMVATQQYLQSYIFLAPTDYDESYADVVEPPGTTLTLDGQTVPSHTNPLNSNWSIARIALPTKGGGTHVLTGSNAIGVQIVGYGAYTSYQYPAGLDLSEISAPPLK